jgi:hypothetical protein
MPAPNVMAVVMAVLSQPKREYAPQFQAVTELEEAPYDGRKLAPT